MSKLFAALLMLEMYMQLFWYDSTKWFSNRYLAKFLDILAKILSLNETINPRPDR